MGTCICVCKCIPLSDLSPASVLSMRVMLSRRIYLPLLPWIGRKGRQKMSALWTKNLHPLINLIKGIYVIRAITTDWRILRSKIILLNMPQMRILFIGVYMTFMGTWWLQELARRQIFLAYPKEHIRLLQTQHQQHAKSNLWNRFLKNNIPNYFPTLKFAQFKKIYYFCTVKPLKSYHYEKFYP